MIRAFPPLAESCTSEGTVGDPARTEATVAGPPFHLSHICDAKIGEDEISSTLVNDLNPSDYSFNASGLRECLINAP